jgi:hypothetical protein
VIQEALERIRAEFIEMPGMRLTAPQVQRLCGIDPLVCEAVLRALVDSRFLARHEDGIYTRMALDTVRQPHQLKAALRSAASPSRDEAPVMARSRR